MGYSNKNRPSWVGQYLYTTILARFSAEVNANQFKSLNY